MESQNKEQLQKLIVQHLARLNSIGDEPGLTVERIWMTAPKRRTCCRVKIMSISLNCIGRKFLKGGYSYKLQPRSWKSADLVTVCKDKPTGPGGAPVVLLRKVYH